jgi:hypothetical protein
MKCKRTNLTKFMLLIPALLMSTTIFMANPATAAPDEKKSEIEQKAMDALGNMGEFLRTLKSFSINSDISMDEVLLSGQKILITGTSQLTARQPDRLLISKKIDEINQDDRFYYDGKTFTLFGNNNRYYASFKAPETINQLIDLAKARYNIEVPLRDLFAWEADSSQASNIQSALFIDSTEINGILCNHFAFRQKEVDWQIWIEQGETPLPRKLVITSKEEVGQPQYMSTMKWDISPEMSEEMFVFTPPEDANEIQFESYEEKTIN